MLNLHTDPARLGELCGTLTCSEDGMPVHGRAAFSAGRLVGFHLALPRALGAHAVTLTLTPDGSLDALSVPLTWCGTHGAEEEYAALLDTAAIAASGTLFFYRITLHSAYGPLALVRRGGCAVGFVPAPATGEAAAAQDAVGGVDFPLLLPDYAYPEPTWLTGTAVYATPRLSEHTPPHFSAPTPANARAADRKNAENQSDAAPDEQAAREEELAASLARLARLGVGAVWLSPEEKGRVHDTRPRQNAKTVLEPALLEAARTAGMRLLPDFWLASGLRAEIGFLSGVKEPPPPSCIPETEEPTPDACGTLPGGGEPRNTRSCCDFFCGDEGVVASWLGAGASGFVLRAADSLGDAFLAAVRCKMAEYGDAPALLGAVGDTGGIGIAFGMRRRFLFGEELDGTLSLALRHALLAFLLRGECAPLAALFNGPLATTPPRLLHTSLNLLSTYESGSFLSACSHAEPGGASLAALAYLVAATLPGNPLIMAGEECADGEGDGGPLFALYARVAALRRREPVYRMGEARLVHLSPGCLIFSREREGEALLTVINAAAKPLLLEADGGFSVVLGGRGRKTAFLLPPYGGAVCKLSLWPGEGQDLRLSRPARATAQDRE